MNTIKSLLMGLVFVGGVFAASASTNYVLQGYDFQTNIDNSAPGDTLVVQAGVYPGNLTFTKPLTVLRSGTNQIQFLGTVQVQGAGATSFAQSQFFSSVQIQATGTVSFSQSQFMAPVTSQSANLLLSQVTSAISITANLLTGVGTNLQIYDSSFDSNPNGFSLSVAGGKVLIKRCTLFGLNLSGNAALEALRMTNFYPFSDGTRASMAISSAGNSPSFVAVQSKFGYLALSGYKVWLGYDQLGVILLTNCDAVMVGNKIFGNAAPVGVYSQGATLKFYNNYINTTSGNSYAMWLRSNVAEIVNNTIVCNSYRAIFVTDGGGPSVFRGDIINNIANSSAIESTGASLIVSYCDLYPQGLAPGTGSAVNCLNQDAIFTSNNELRFDSPCINAGPPDAIYNDRDGSRNDMGFTGGPLYNPANYTNNNPMVFFLTGSPQMVFKGVQTNIQVNAAASAGH